MSARKGGEVIYLYRVAAVDIARKVNGGNITIHSNTNWHESGIILIQFSTDFITAPRLNILREFAEHYFWTRPPMGESPLGFYIDLSYLDPISPFGTSPEMVRATLSVWFPKTKLYMATDREIWRLERKRQDFLRALEIKKRMRWAGT